MEATQIAEDLGHFEERLTEHDEEVEQAKAALSAAKDAKEETIRSLRRYMREVSDPQERLPLEHRKPEPVDGEATVLNESRMLPEGKIELEIPENSDAAGSDV